MRWCFDLPIGFAIADAIIALILACFIMVFIIRKINRVAAYIFYPSCVCLMFVGYVFTMPLLLITSSVVLVIGMSLILFINASEFRYLFLKNATLKTTRKDKNTKNSTELMYKAIDDAVKSLSRTKTGAIITFEKAQSLDNVIKNGTAINAPVSAELLMTIFYPGTRLHDGAVVIRGNVIISASVYYTPTTRALTGKYGSRHRAAVGISEISDAVTVVVSEETGRISLAYKAKLEPTSLDTFLDDFVYLMNERD